MIDWIESNIPPWFWILLVVHLAVLGSVAYMILLERKVASWVQDRIGPNRVGLGFGIIPFLKDMKMFGLGQPLADGLKFILKEDYRPKNADRVLFTIAPMVMIVVVIISIAVIPWGGVKETNRRLDLTGTTTEAIFDAPPAERRAAIAARIPHGATIVGDPVIRSLPPSTDIVTGHEIIPAQRVADVTYRWPFQIAELNIGVLFILAALS
ncbi:MAG: NADH-quinone oxidoreductase subunit H, partial [Tepidisphaeraceae bacterium]